MWGGLAAASAVGAGAVDVNGKVFQFVGSVDFVGADVAVVVDASERGGGLSPRRGRR